MQGVGCGMTARTCAAGPERGSRTFHECQAPAIDQCDMVERLPEVGFRPHVAVTFRPRSWLRIGRVSTEPVPSGEVIVEDTTDVNSEVVTFEQVRAGQHRVNNAACLPFIREGPGE